MTNEEIASVAHEANRAYCATIGDRSQPAWRAAQEWQRESAVAGVEAVRANPETTPEESHKGWMKHKKDDGWVHGETKDPAAKTHPCLVPYSKLPAEHKVKDALYLAVVKTLLGFDEEQGK